MAFGDRRLAEEPPVPQPYDPVDCTGAGQRGTFVALTRRCRRITTNVWPLPHDPITDNLAADR
jgi:hypothetical protein